MVETQTKNQLRSQFLKTRSQLERDDWQSKSTLICQNLQSFSVFTQAKTVLAYFSIQNEPNLHQLFTNSQQIWGFPRCVGQQMTWWEWKPGDPLQTGRYGILEPTTDANIITPNQVDLILVPCVAGDRRGYRLGYGGGYYDRMFASPEWLTIPSIGILFDFALIHELPIEPWDRQLSYVCTERQIIRF